MATWEIKLVDRPSLVVAVEDARNLAVEHDALVKTALTKRPWWRRGAESDPYWQITPEHRIHVAIIAGVVPVVKRPADKRAPIGFQLPPVE